MCLPVQILCLPVHALQEQNGVLEHTLKIIDQGSKFLAIIQSLTGLDGRNNECDFLERIAPTGLNVNNTGCSPVLFARAGTAPRSTASNP